MAEPLTAGVLVGLAVQKFVESGAGELAKKFTAEAIAKIPELWQRIKNKLQGKSPKVDEALAKLESGDRSAIDTVTKNLDVVLDDEPEFAEQLKVLAKEIQAGKLQDNSNMVQNVTGDNNMNVQAKAEQGGKQYIAERMYFGTSEDD
jgi:predicted amino acid racemase